MAPFSRASAGAIEPAAGNPAAGDRSGGAPVGRRQRRLFVKYVLFFVALVSVVLLVNGGLDVWFSYSTARYASHRILREKAVAAAQQIGAFVADIKQQLGWTTLPLWSSGTLDEREFDFVRLLRQVPAITDLTELDRSGHEVLKVSRIGLDVVNGGVDDSRKPGFIAAMAHGMWFSPVFFRDMSEPYMTVAMALDGHAGVVIAAVNLKLIWDTVRSIRVGARGYAYVVDPKGRLIADPDISLVLRETDFATLPQVREALAQARAAPGAPVGHEVSMARNWAGKMVMTAHSKVAALGWIVFVELPLDEALQPLYAALERSVGVLLLGFALALVASVLLARRMVGPIQALGRGAARIGAGDLGGRIEIRTGDELESLADEFNDMASRLRTSYAELEGKVEARTAELSAALDQQTATSEVLQVINSSPGDLAPVFDTMLEKALRLCEAGFGSLVSYRDGEFHLVASRGLPEKFAEFLRAPLPAPPGTPFGRLVGGEPVVHVTDITAGPTSRSEVPGRTAMVEMTGGRTVLWVALRRDETLIGAFVTYRTEVRPFSAKQIALLQNFAAQAVIAMENARLLGELRTRTGDLQESLEYQTATSEVLKVISRSTFDLEPVLDTLTETAARLCDASLSAIAIRKGEEYRFVTTFSASPEFDALLRRRVFIPGRGTVTGRAALERRVIHVADMAADPDLAVADLMRIGKLHTMLGVPLLREGEPMGVIALARQRVEPFAERQIELVRTFADQAVIAMENARLLTETRDRTRDLQESLEYQTATSDVLKVISRSALDLDAVLQTVVITAIRLCHADSATIYREDDGEYRWAAGHMLLPAYEQIERASRIRPGPGTLVGRVAAAARTVQIVDAWNDPLYEVKDDARLAGVHTMVGVPLLREGVPIGVIGLARLRVEAFSEREIALVSTFADQAVIAIENARLIAETREALDQQTATAEVLQVINGSPGDLAPVFDAMLDKAAALCEAELGLLLTYDGDVFNTAALHGAPQAYADFMTRGPLRAGPSTGLARMVRERRLVHIADLAADDSYRQGEPLRVASVDLGGMRTFLAVPLVKDELLLGAFIIYRQEVRPFSEKQIALVQNFAAQAVIAMESARLFEALRGRTEELAQRQAELRATFENMADGVAMFDATQRLAAWNGHFQRIMKLPDEFLAGVPHFPDFIRHLTERGAFGAVDPEIVLRRFAEEVGASTIERTRADGTVIEVRQNPVPGGGFVLICGDITARKEAEAQIRAAKESAEAALGELKATQANLIQAEKMASLGQLTAGIAHEIKNPLNFVNNFAGLSVELLGELKEAAGPGIAALDANARAEIDEVMAMLVGNLEKIAEHGKRADGIVKSMLLHSRSGGGERQSTNLNALVEESLSLAFHGARAQDKTFNITLERDLDPTLAPIEIVPQDVTRVFLNLFGNGFYAANKRRGQAADAAFRPVLKVTTRDLGDAAEIRVRDNGIGIPPAVRDKLFTPFFTTKPTGEGTGLGLSISYDIVVKQHGGTIAVDSVPGEFTEFTVRLPRLRGERS